MSKQQSKKLGLSDVTAVKWWWKADDKWTEYKAELQPRLEMEYQRGTKRIKVDDERFIDTSLTLAQIKSNFLTIEDAKDSELVGIQRRFDDESKRRLVKRTVTKYLKGVTCVILSEDEEFYDVARIVIETYGGSVKTSITKRIKLVVCNANEIDHFSDSVNQAHKNNVPVVTEQYLIDCMKLNKKLETDNYLVKSKESDKRKRDDEQISNDDTNLPPAKKAKTVESTTTTEENQSNNNRNSQVAASDPRTTETTTKVTTVTNRQACDLLRSGSTWMGVCSYEEEQQYFPCLLTVISVNGNVVEGTIDWPTINNAKTKVKGTITGDEVEFTEYEIIAGGEDSVEMPVTYNGKISGSTITGVVKETASGISGRFNLKLLPPEDEAESEEEGVAESNTTVAKFFKPDTVYKGSCFTEFSFEMKILKRKGNQLEGVFYWPSLKCQTKFKAVINGNDLNIDEYEVVKTETDGIEVEVLLLFSCRNIDLFIHWVWAGSHELFWTFFLGRI